MRLRAGMLWIACAAFIAYLSFVPFRFQPLEFGQALAQFARIRYLDLGAASRADWVANILMFLPLGALAAAAIAPRPRFAIGLAAIVGSLTAGTALALALEFGQLYFPNRTVSINDIVAEVIGTAIGAVLWCAYGARGRDWWRALLVGGRATVGAALGAYVLAYLVLSFSPFDFVLSADEIVGKLGAGLHGWWLAPVGCGRAPCSVKLAIEALAVLPFGWWWATRRRSGGSVFVAALLGAALGALIELAQLLLVSGTSQGASVLSRAAGVAAGAWLHSARHLAFGVDWARWGRPLVVAAVVPWLAAVAYVSGWFNGGWLGIESGLARGFNVQWLPFYFQYYSTEQALIRSTLLHLALYAPVGFAVWLWSRKSRETKPWVAASLAAAVAVVAETGKLFVGGRHPDYTDVLFAAFAAWALAKVLRFATDKARAGGSKEDGGLQSVQGKRAGAAGAAEQGGEATGLASTPPEEAAASGAAQASPDPLAAPWRWRVAAVAILLGVAVSLLRFPVWQLPLAVGLAAYAALLLRFPLAYATVLPLALPLLDLATYSGRFFWDEFDLLIATTIAARLATMRPQAVAVPKALRAGLWLLALSVFASAAVALWPPAPLDANAFTNYLSPYNALRVAKGYLWAAALFWLLLSDAGSQPAVGERLLRGLALGLLAAAVGVFWERSQFVGPLDLGVWFRAAGLVSSTHVGGAYLEGMLVVLTPFALAAAVGARRLRHALPWVGVTVLGALATLMTLSRAAAMAWLIAVVSFALIWRLVPRGPLAAAKGRRRVAGGIIVVVVLAAGATLIVQSSALRARLLASGPDLELRLGHWRSTFDLLPPDPMQVVLGTGLGSFPREFYLVRGVSARLPAYQLEVDKVSGGTVLKLAGGRGMYMDQRVAAAESRELVLRGRVRASRDGANLDLGLCMKSFLTSVSCAWAVLPVATAWSAFEIRLAWPTTPAGAAPWAPVSLTLHHSAFGTRIEVDDLSLRDGSRELLANGGFENGLDRWLMHSDVHLAWRSLSTPVQVAFEQGLLGILAWFTLAVGVVSAVVRRPGEAPVAATAAACVGALAVGAFDMLLDSPRLIVLAAMVLWLAVGAGSSTRQFTASKYRPAATPATRVAPPAPARA